MRNVNVWHDPDFFTSLSDGFSALPGTSRTAPSDDGDRNAESPDVERSKRRSRRERKERKTADAVLVAQLRAGVDALRAARAKAEREERARSSRSARRDDPAWQAEQAALQAERAAVRAARAARLAREREAGHKTPSAWAERDAMLDARTKGSWRVRQQHEPFPAWGKLVRGYAAHGEIDAAREAASMAWVHERFVSFARRKLHDRATLQHERAVLERLMSSDPEAFAAHSVLARTIMDE